MDLVDLIKNFARKIEVPRPPTIADTTFNQNLKALGLLVIYML